ncbi:MAG: hypothetical protein A4E52_00435 [Pelotomaculum sp. PtaB.Bin013]|nr:MAG: hypothetical protein A4E52_00435 [Pelotomaculum sp. PtaB.Bin013]
MKISGKKGETNPMLLSEQETIIRFDEESEIAEVYTISPRVQKLWISRRASRPGGFTVCPRLPFY